MSTANGWTLIDLPCPWSWTTMDWTIRVGAASSDNPFTDQSQVQVWMGKDGWLVTVTTPPMSVDQFDDWRAFLWDAQGGANAFMLGDPLRRKPKGSVNTPITVNGTNAAMAQSLNLKGFHPNQPRVLLRGDLISVNSRLYTVRNQYVSADASGHATVSIGPSIRETLTDGMAVVTHDATGMFRLAKGDTQYHIDQNHQYTMSFQAREAR